jgi:ankyrin repeat protein
VRSPPKKLSSRSKGQGLAKATVSPVPTTTTRTSAIAKNRWAMLPTSYDDLARKGLRMPRTSDWLPATDGALPGFAPRHAKDHLSDVQSHDSHESPRATLTTSTNSTTPRLVTSLSLEQIAASPRTSRVHKPSPTEVAVMFQRLVQLERIAQTGGGTGDLEDPDHTQNRSEDHFPASWRSGGARGSLANGGDVTPASLEVFRGSASVSSPKARANGGVVLSPSPSPPRQRPFAQTPSPGPIPYPVTATTTPLSSTAGGRGSPSPSPGVHAGSPPPSSPVSRDVVGTATPSSHRHLHESFGRGNPSDSSFSFADAKENGNVKANSTRTLTPHAANTNHARVPGGAALQPHTIRRRRADSFTPAPRSLQTFFGFIMDGNLESAIHMLEEGRVSPEAQDSENGMTAMHCAAAAGRLEMAEYLVRVHGAVADKPAHDGARPIHMAAISGHADMIRFLAKVGVDVESHGPGGSAPLFFANGNADVVHALRQYGARLISRDAHQRIPLHVAAYTGRVPILRAILEHSHNEQVLLRDGPPGRTVLHFAILHATECAEEEAAISKHNGIPRSSKKKYEGEDDKRIAGGGGGGGGGVHGAPRDGDAYIACIEEILADPRAVYTATIPDTYGATPMHYAARCKSAQVFTILHQAGIPYDAPDLKGRTPLMYALTSHCYATAKALLEAHIQDERLDIIRRMNLDDVDKGGMCALALAVSIPETPMYVVQALLEAGADPNGVPIQNGRMVAETPLLIVASHLRLETAQLLLRYGAIARCRNMNQQTVLHVAAGAASLDHDADETRSFIRGMVQAGVPVEATDAEGRTMLHVACLQGNLMSVRVAVEECGANMAAQDLAGRTPLHLAVRTLWVRVVRQLMLYASAPVNVPDRDGFTPLQLADRVMRHGSNDRERLNRIAMMLQVLRGKRGGRKRGHQ